MYYCLCYLCYYYFYLCKNHSIKIYMIMELLKNTKYCAKTIFNYKPNRIFVRMMKNLTEKESIKSEKKNCDEQKQKQNEKFRRYRKLFIKHTGMSDRDVKLILNNDDEIFGIPENKLARNLTICKNLNIEIPTSVYNVGFFRLKPDELKNRVRILKELGVKYLNSTIIKSMAKDVPMNLFKTFTGIPKNTRVLDILYSHLDKPPPNIPQFNNIDDDMTVNRYRNECWKHYIRWRLQLSNVNEEDLNSFIISLKQKTFAKVDYAFHVLHNEGKMPIKTIWQYRCLTKCSGTDMKKIFDKIQVICDVPIIELLKISPELHRMTFKTTLVIKKYLEENKITSEQIKNYPKVLLLDEATFIKSWKIMNEIPQLKILLKHPWFLRVFTKNNTFDIRFQYLNYLNITNFTVNILSTTQTNFERCVRVGTFRFRAKEICISLKNRLPSSTDRLLRLLRQHPGWHHVDLLTLHDTLNYLKEKFSDEDIENNISLTLYSKETVDSVLKYLIHKNESMDKTNRYTPSQLLALCLYEIEKKYHFTGDSIYDEKHMNKNY